MDLEAIRKRAEAATEGPWEMVDDFLGLNVRTVEKPATSASGREEAYHIAHGTCTGDVDFARDDADFIAHARTDVPALVTEVERLRDGARHTRQVTDAVQWATRERAERAEATVERVQAVLNDNRPHYEINLQGFRSAIARALDSREEE